MQSNVPLYIILIFPPFVPAYIIILLLIVSKGYEATPANAVTVYPIA